MATGAQGARRRGVNGQKIGWRDLLIPSGVLAALIGAVPSCIQLFQSLAMGVAMADVPISKHNEMLWARNNDCPVRTKSVELTPDLNIAIGACEQTGDILVRVSRDKGGRVEMVRWIESIDGASRTALLDHLLSVSHAQTVATDRLRLAENDDGTVCNRNLGSGKIRQRIRENGQCFDLVINIYTGKVVSRSPAACNSDCSR